MVVSQQDQLKEGVGGGTNRPVTANVIFCHYDLFQISGEGHIRAMGHICYKGGKLNRILY